MKTILYFLLILFLTGCQTSVDNNVKSSTETTFTFDVVSDLKIAIPDELAYKSYFNTDEHLLQLELYKLNNNEWTIFQTIDSIHSQFGNDSLEIMDFNFDGIQDFRLFVGTAGRSANEYYNIFIQNSTTNYFHVIDSYNIPNLLPDSSKKIINAIRYFSNKTLFENYILEANALILSDMIRVEYQGDFTYRYYETYNHHGAIIETKIDSIKDYGKSLLSPEPF